MPNGLQFWRNADAGSTSDPMQAIQFVNPQSDGLPVWGPSGAGVTVIREVKILHQASDTGTYYAQFWWSQNDGNWTPDETHPAWGFHPYPKSGKSAGEGHYHEVQTGFANDYVTTRASTPSTVVYDTWMLQAIRVIRNSANSKTLIYYLDLPSTADADVIEYAETTTGYGESMPSANAITIGDSPWFGVYVHECFCGVLGRIKIFDKALSESDMLSEAADMTQLVTTDGQNHIWWGKTSFDSVDDLTCDYGTSRSFAWYDSDTKASLTELPFGDPMRLNPGYWQTTYWPASYWGATYWPGTPGDVLQLLASITGSSTTPDISAVIARALLANIQESTVTPDIASVIARAIISTISASSTTPDAQATLMRDFLAAISATSATPDIATLISRALLAQIAASSTTSDISSITSRVLIAQVAATSTTPDITATITGLINLLASIVASSTTPVISATTVRSAIANIAVSSLTPDIVSVTARALLASISGTSVTPDIAGSISRAIIAAITGASTSPDIASLTSRALASNIAASSVTPDISITIQGLVSLLANIAATSTTPDIATTTARSMLASITASSAIPDIQSVLSRALIAALSASSTTPDITATVENMINLAAAIVGVSLTSDVAVQIARTLSAIIGVQTVTPGLQITVARMLLADIRGTSITPNNLVLILAGLGVILDPTIESSTTVRTFASLTTERSIHVM